MLQVGLEENLEEKREKEREKKREKDEKRRDKEKDTDQDQDKETELGKVQDKDQKIGYKVNKEDCADSIEVEYTENLEGELKKELERDGALGAEEKKREGRLGEIGIGVEKERRAEKEAHHHHGMPKGWTAMKDLRGKQKQKQKQKQKYKAGERANGNTHTHAGMTSTGISKSQTDGDGEVVEEEIEDLDDLDLAELNSGDDLLPDEDDEEEGGVRGGGIGVHGTDGAADEELGRGSSERETLVLLNIIVSWDWLTFSASSTTVSQYYNVSESAINWLSTAFLFAFVLASPFVIYVLHHGGPKPAILIASVLLLLGNWIRYGATRSGRHGNFGGVMFGQILTGIAQPFVLAAPTRYSDLWFTNQGRVAATAVMSLANPFGGALAQLIDPFWAGSVGSIPNMYLLPHKSNALPPTPLAKPTPGIAGALLIVVGLVAAAITSPLIDRTKTYLLAIKIQIPILGICYLAFTWAPQTRSLAAIYSILSILGAASFSLVPVALEYLIELTHPVSPEVTSTICWSGGQLLGGVFIIVSDKLRAKGVSDGSMDDGSTRPQGNMYNALVFQTVLALVVIPLPLALGCCGRGRGVRMRRVEADKEASGRRGRRLANSGGEGESDGGGGGGGGGGGIFP
ncbi:hypothetical protein EYC84_003523 [Monilinia fructicola]|uniref:Major facilitator superfamily (MFS) profile domain-containing protein n=1 Tax=Monilinia fructicola TaxID=38448 RepID=A0A5M9JTY1_MONFR|nr:hypothetical protein EYC84_003523 [Monilinia fructicola]